MEDPVFAGFVNGNVNRIVDRLIKRGDFSREAVLEEAGRVFPDPNVAPCDLIHAVRKGLDSRGIQDHQLG